MNRQTPHFYEFGPFRLNATERLLLRDGSEVPLTPKVFDTLLVLVENSGHVLEKQELFSTLWPDSFVEETSLTQNISLLRKVLGEEEAGRRYIETLPKRGYRFVAPVREKYEAGAELALLPVGASAPPAPGEDTVAEVGEIVNAPPPAPAASRGRAWVARARPWHYAIVICALVLPPAIAVFINRGVRPPTPVVQARSIAVLPFKTIGAEDETEVVGLGMADAIIIRLSSLQQPTILPISSVFKYAKREQDVLAIGRALGVDAVLDGTVQQADGRVRVTAQLISLADGKTIWADKFDERHSNIFAVQDSISAQLVEALAPQLTEADRERLARRPTENAEAYQSYLLGLTFWNRRAIAKAIPYLEQAVAQDANFARAQAILADCYFLSISDQPGSASAEMAARAERLSNRALELDATLAEAYIVVAGLKVRQRDYEAAAAAYKHALELNPNFATAHIRYGYFLFAQAELDAALHEMQRAQALDPLSAVTNGALGYMLMMARDEDEALKFTRRAYDLEPNQLANQVNLCEAYIHKGLYEEAVVLSREVEAQDRPTARLLFAYARAAAGHHAEAQLSVTELLRPGVREKVGPYNLALIYGVLGDKDKAFRWLDRVDALPMTRALLRFDPDLDSLRTDPRFTVKLQ
jgi:DNA-binding winged helix-turn-helix (wHTH) protein/TolB-like protein/Flp pilus assembly protein TadD